LATGFIKDILIPTIISVLNEPKYRSKYLGLSAAKGYFYVRRAASGQNEGGTLTLRQSLATTLAVQPDFIIMPRLMKIPISNQPFMIHLPQNALSIIIVKLHR
jgi:hypothetical protein